MARSRQNVLNLIWKNPRFVPFGANLTQFGCEIWHPCSTRKDVSYVCGKINVIFSLWRNLVSYDDKQLLYYVPYDTFLTKILWHEIRWSDAPRYIVLINELFNKFIYFIYFFSSYCIIHNNIIIMIISKTKSYFHVWNSI